MQELNLYNKYRPKSLSDLIGQETIKNQIRQIFTQNKLLQSFIFYGLHGTGKTSVARIFSKAWNCPKFSELGDVCNECESCKLIDQNRTTDIYEIDAASNSGVENIRDVIHHTKYFALNLKKKVYIIDEAHNLSNSAWNALLKTIEEPSEYVIFLFLTTNIQKIPDTIISRCHKYNFNYLSTDNLITLINTVCKAESREISSEASERLANLAEGSARECLSLLEQVFLNAPDTIEVSDIEQVFSLSSRKDTLHLASLIISGTLEESLKYLESLNHLNKNLFNYFSELLSLFLDIFIYKETSNDRLMRRFSSQEIQGLLNFPVLDGADILYEFLKKYSPSSGRFEWYQLLLFKLHELIKDHVPSSPEVKKLESKPIVEVSSEIKEIKITTSPSPKKENRQFELKIPKISISEDLEKKIFYSFKNSSKSLSKENWTLHQKLVDGDKLNSEFKELFKRISKKCGLFSTSKTVLVVFDEDKDVTKFYDFLKKDEIQETLKGAFLKEYFWIALTSERFKHYHDLFKTKKEEEYLDHLIFDTSKRSEVYKDVVKILESD
ncbi:DNA polymerase III, subunit gamma and tau [Mycoplasma haemocanis str. Illinois]|uniref:DNA polymerase III subunit gamma/tau n=1 Tax=Mycoplasma haemocanis (strain Illinois) TaxID=1111676 RepID=H6N5H3_MYCHN|nr:DNA polymerase III subunit gamma/tau [Mycoplasma haemocanis]AEW44933.1 DNA polymerase III, subunit gamma and tau [Mycoplasma haemocanis str. Illinois]